MPPLDEQFWILAGLALVAAVLGFVVRTLVRGSPRPVPADGPLRLVVQPLKELKPDPNHLYLGTTISRELASLLRSFDRLEPALGDGPSALLLDGTVRKSGPRLVMNIRLLSGRHPIWRGTYDGAIADLPGMESEIVQNVARVLRVGPRLRSVPAA